MSEPADALMTRLETLVGRRVTCNYDEREPRVPGTVFGASTRKVRVEWDNGVTDKWESDDLTVIEGDDDEV